MIKTWFWGNIWREKVCWQKRSSLAPPTWSKGTHPISKHSWPHTKYKFWLIGYFVRHQWRKCCKHTVGFQHVKNYPGKLLLPNLTVPDTIKMNPNSFLWFQECKQVQLQQVKDKLVQIDWANFVGVLRTNGGTNRLSLLSRGLLETLKILVIQ